MLRKLGSSTEDAVIKAHKIDKDLVELINLTHGKVIITVRDPRDIIVSQRDRFGHDEIRSITDLSQTYSCINSLSEKVQRLFLHYEDIFFDKCDTVRDVARFIGLDVSEHEAATLLEQLQPDHINSYIAAWSAENIDLTSERWDTVTQWHPNHLGDGQSGKWRERLSHVHQEITQEALGGLLRDDWKRRPLSWPSRLFFHDGKRIDSDKVSIRIEGADQFYLWGPYMHLPIGRWRFTPRLATQTRDKSRFRMDISTRSGTNLLAMKIVSLPSDYEIRHFIDIDVTDYMDPLEFRIFASPEDTAHFLFSGLDLTYLGACDGEETPDSHSVLLQ